MALAASLDALRKTLALLPGRICGSTTHDTLAGMCESAGALQPSSNSAERTNLSCVVRLL